MAELCITQKSLSERIDKLYMNTKKSPKTRITRGYLETRLECLEDMWAKYTQQYDDIIKSISMEALEKLGFNASENLEKTEDTYLELKAFIKDSLNDLTKINSKQETIQQSSETVECSKPRAKLPPISIPKFSGNYNDWLSFRDLFISLVDKDASLSKVEKHHYLRSSLSGEAEQLLKHFSVTEANYEKAWEIIENRYNNKRIIINSILNRLFNQRKSNTECAHSLKELLDTTKECLNSLQNLEINTSSWDAIIIHIVVSKLDSESHKQWEQSLGSSQEVPTFKQLTSFLESHFRTIEMLNTNVRETKPKREFYKPQHGPHKPTTTSAPIKTFLTEADTKCTYCTRPHYICHCEDFAQLDITQRQEFVKQNGICFNCLVKGHSVNKCRQSTCCKKCGRRHHTLLHYTHPNKTTTTDLENGTSVEKKVVSMKTDMDHDPNVLLATARIAVLSKYGNTHILRALVDPGSQASFITEAAAQLLGLDRTKMHGEIKGLDDTKVGTTKALVALRFHSTRNTTPLICTTAYVVTRVTSQTPSQELNIDDWSSLENLELADPDFNKPGTIEILLGSDVHANLMIKGLHRHESLLALNSHLGWFISGEVTQLDSQPRTVLVTHTKHEVDHLLRRFWELEEPQTDKRTMTKLENQCEEHYKTTHTRNKEGRYIVRLPFKNEVPQVGDSKQMAIRRLLQMENKFKHRPEFKEEYCKFLKQYELQGHMEVITEEEEPEKEEININNCVEKQKNNQRFYLPHHAILRESSLSTKLRVVFDGSAQPENGNSLNDELLIGPPLQQDLRDLVIRWRTHKVCLTADIKQMYRQILVHQQDADYQRIIWRASTRDVMKEYRLLTVTYGTSCAPYLAIKTLQQLADDEEAHFPVEAQILRTDVYMDDIMTGTDTEADTKRLKERLTDLLLKGGFLLHKWASNSKLVLNEVPDNEKMSQSSVNIRIDDSVKALGIKWNPSKDVFELKIDNIDSCKSESVTKRSVLSTISKMFDPLGWLAPLTVGSKIFMQKLWLAGLEWDDPLPSDLLAEWLLYSNNLKNMECIQMPRWYGTWHNNVKVELHGFCDASCAAYAAVVYIRVINDEDIDVQLVIAKTKVAPVKQVTLPRLELCGAVLLAKLLCQIKSSLQVSDDSVFGWTDSTIVLAWLRKNPNNWKPFIANRTAEILNVLNSSQWHHIKSQNNPADCASRGVSPFELNKLWWEGPAFLKESVQLDHSSSVIPETTLETKQKLTNLLCTNEKSESEAYLKRYSKLSKLIRVTAYCLRFINNCKQKRSEYTERTNYLSTSEITHALHICIKISQNIYFNEEIEQLSKKGPLKWKNSKLSTLNPMLDQNGLLRVGGRIINSPLPYDTKCPIILSPDCNFTKLLVMDAHFRSLHGGIQLTLNIIKQKYWILRAKNLVKRMIHQCIPCFKNKAVPKAPFMGDLPECRVNPTRPFRSCGVDFAGPFILKLYSGRCQRTSKAYISLFVCTVTKAIHLELVSDLTSSAFIAAFKRFTSRRGHCREMWSDCGTNFVGASRELDLQLRKAKSNLVQEISQLLSNDNTTWHFNPPSSPHFGGLWEAGVKSVKGHIKRVIGQSRLTFEEFNTLLTQVEACVNSRPLTLINCSLDEPPLTPGHFLIGEPPITVPEENLIDVPTHRLDRWQLVQRMTQHLWRRWQSEYLTTLQHRYKWSTPQPEIEIDTVVLVKDERLPPGKWLMGRVVEKHPGADGVTRVVSLKHNNHIFKRPVAKLCPLPLESS